MAEKKEETCKKYNNVEESLQCNSIIIPEFFLSYVVGSCCLFELIAKFLILFIVGKA